MRFNIIHIYAKKFSAAALIYVDCKINFLIYEFVYKMAQIHLKRDETFNNSNDMQTCWMMVFMIHLKINSIYLLLRNGIH